jgi:citrate lyase synthetase
LFSEVTVARESMNNYKKQTIKSILNIHSRYLNKWFNLLCNTKENYDLFMNDFLAVHDLEESLFEFQAYLRMNGRGENISIDGIREYIFKKDSVALKNLLEEYLLIPVDRSEARIIMKYKWTYELEKILNELKEISNKQFSKVIEENVR